MRERLFPRWCTALFALLPMSELLYLPADGQSVYAAALACTVCALVGIGAAKLSDRVRHSAPAQWVLALTSLFPLLASIARMPARVKCAELAWRTLEKLLERETAAGREAR